MITSLAPAKINLTLEVVGRRSDGYHEISSVVQSIGLCDELTFASADELSLSSSGLDIAHEDNLVLKAARLVRQAGGKAFGAAITLKKAIPAAAGLGGGSSDAAATLMALNRLWGLSLSRDDLVGLAARLGSDVPFFIYGGTCLVEGKGEKVSPILAMASPKWVVMLCPDIPLPEKKTQEMYRSLEAADFTDGRYTVRMVQELTRAGRVSGELLFNVFEKVALRVIPALGSYWNVMQNAGSAKVSLAGSGPVLFSLFSSPAEAQKLYDRLLSGGYRVYLVQTLN